MNIDIKKEKHPVEKKKVIRKKKSDSSIVDELGDPEMGYDYDAENYYTYNTPSEDESEREK